MTRESGRPTLVVTVGDPAGIGPEILLKVALRPPAGCRLVFVAEPIALASVREQVAAAAWERLVFSSGHDAALCLERSGADASTSPPAVNDGQILVIDPVREDRTVVPGRSGAADAKAAVLAVDLGVELVTRGDADGLVTGPVSKSSIARHHLPSFRGHTEYLAEGAGLARYGRDYLMTFLTPDQQIALLSTHLPLIDAVRAIDEPSVVEALCCLHRHAGGRIALAGLNPHAGEGGLIGREDAEILVPAVERARALGVDVVGPESPDSLFSRHRAGEFDWVLALYHDQGLISVKTVSFGSSTNWTLGLPFLRTSVDHGTAFDIAGRGVADERPLVAVLETTAQLVAGQMPRRTEQPAAEDR